MRQKETEGNHTMHLTTPRLRRHAFPATFYLFPALVSLLLAALAVVPPVPVRAAALTVVNCNPNGTGSLPDMLALAGAGDTITFTVDCTGASAITLLAMLTPTVDVTIDATSPPHAVTISAIPGGDINVSLFRVNGGITLSLRGVTLANSKGDGYDGYGGAILNEGTLNVVGSTFSGNSVSRNTSGGAIFNNSGTVNVIGSTFSGNSVSGGDGGAIFNRKGMMNVVGSTFSGNAVADGRSYGGAIENTGTLSVVGSTFSGNTASDSGGAIDNTGTLYVIGSTFSGNAAFTGGTIANFKGGTLAVVSGTFSGNTASGSGGVIYNGGTVNVVGSTFSGNTARYNGGAISNVTRSPLGITLSVVAGNTATTGPDIEGAVTTDGGGNVVGDTTGSKGLTAPDDKLGISAMLASLASNGGPVQTFALLSGSPAIAIAPCPVDPITNLPLATDARGISRPQGTNCDAGSYQATPAHNPSCSSDPSLSCTGHAFLGRLWNHTP